MTDLRLPLGYSEALMIASSRWPESVSNRLTLSSNWPAVRGDYRVDHKQDGYWCYSSIQSRDRDRRTAITLSANPFLKLLWHEAYAAHRRHATEFGLEHLSPWWSPGPFQFKPQIDDTLLDGGSYLW